MANYEFPLIYEPNLIDSDTDTISVSSGTATIDFIYDYKGSIQWQTQGSNDATQEIIDIMFLNVDGNKMQRNIDRIVLINCNLKSFKLQSSNWNGSTWSAWADIAGTTFITNSDNNLVISITNAIYWRVRLVMNTTIVADDEKKIGQLIFTVVKYELPEPMSVYNIKNVIGSSIYRLYDGKGVKIVRHDKYAANIEFRQISETVRNELKSISEQHKSFLWIPEPYDENGDDYKLEEFYLVHWIKPYEEKYFTVVKGAGYNLRIQVEEV